MANQPTTNQENKMHRGLATAILILLAAGAFYLVFTRKAPQDNTAVNNPPPPPPPASQPANKTFTNDEYHYQFSYLDHVKDGIGEAGGPTEPSFTTAGGLTQSVLSWPKSLYPNTNFSRAIFTSAVNSSVKTQNSCNQVKSEGSLGSPEKIGMFNRVITTGAAAGTKLESRIYHVFQNSICYELSFRLFTSNIGNFEQGTVMEFQEQPFWDEVAKIADSFKFLPIASVNELYVDKQLGFKLDHRQDIAVGGKAKNSSLGTFDVLVPGIYVGHYVFVPVSTDGLRKQAQEYVQGYIDAALNPPSQEEIAMGAPNCKTEKVNNSVSINLVACTGEGGPATYGLIKGDSYDILSTAIPEAGTVQFSSRIFLTMTLRKY